MAPNGVGGARHQRDGANMSARDVPEIRSDSPISGSSPEERAHVLPGIFFKRQAGIMYIYIYIDA